MRIDNSTLQATLLQIHEKTIAACDAMIKAAEALHDDEHARAGGFIGRALHAAAEGYTLGKWLEAMQKALDSGDASLDAAVVEFEEMYTKRLATVDRVAGPSGMPMPAAFDAWNKVVIGSFGRVKQTINEVLDLEAEGIAICEEHGIDHELVNDGDPESLRLYRLALCNKYDVPCDGNGYLLISAEEAEARGVPVDFVHPSKRRDAGLDGERSEVPDSLLGGGEQAADASVNPEAVRGMIFGASNGDPKVHTIVLEPGQDISSAIAKALEEMVGKPPVPLFAGAPVRRQPYEFNPAS